MKVSISLPDKDVAFLDEYAKENGLESRSAAVHSAVRALLDTTLEAEYTAAFAEWSEEDERWVESGIADGLEPDFGWTQ